MDRHQRQMRLPMVGKGGQKAITEATFDVPVAGVEGEIMARYLAGAGVMQLRTADEGAAAAARAIDARVVVSLSPGAIPSSIVRAEPMAELDDLDPAARDVARGARAAVRLLVRVLRASVLPRDEVDDG